MGMIRRSDTADKALVSALDDSMQSFKRSSRTQLVGVDQIAMNPDNARRYPITLAALVEGLRVGQPDCRVQIEDGKAVFPDVEEAGQYLDLSTQRAREFYLNIVGLAESITIHDELLSPVEVYVTDGDERPYMLNMGHRRYMAHVVLGRPSIEVIAKKEPSPYRRVLRRWDENDKHHPLSLVERLKCVEVAIRAYEQEHGAKPKQAALARDMAIKTPDMSQMFKVLRAQLSDTELTFIDTHQLNDLRVIAELCDLPVDERMKSLIIYRDRGNGAAVAFAKQVKSAADAEAHSEAAAPVVAAPRKLKPTATNVSRLVDLLRGVQPALVDGIELDTLDPKTLLAEILHRLEQDERGGDDAH